MTQHHRMSDVDHHMKPFKCPNCGKTLDGASGIDYDGRPSPGDYSVCIGCAAILSFDDDLEPHSMSIEDIQAMHPENRKVISALVLSVHLANRNRRLH
jgi:hypothetical protein